ncbi:MAG: VOC family protein [Alphaproteobacteria bacterium]|nr:VOC family protein [Alphaproteobacteria bacterium]
MEFKVRRSGHIVIRVADVARSARFFTDVLGLTIIGNTDRQMYFLTADFEANHHMVLVRPAKPGAAQPDPDRRIGLAQAAFEVGSLSDLKALYARLRAAGATIERSEDRGAIKALFARDPDGNLFEFYCREGGGTPKLADRYRVRGSIDHLLAPAPASA